MIDKLLKKVDIYCDRGEIVEQKKIKVVAKKSLL